VALLLLRRLPMLDHPTFTNERKQAIVRHCDLVSLPANSKGTGVGGLGSCLRAHPPPPRPAALMSPCYGRPIFLLLGRVCDAMFR
jgi:hypothetical protein